MDLDPEGKHVATIEAENANKRNGLFICYQEIFMLWLKKKKQMLYLGQNCCMIQKKKDLAEQAEDAS